MNCWQKLVDMTGFAEVSNELQKKFKDTFLRVENKEKGTVHYGTFQGESMNGDGFALRCNTGVLSIPFNHNELIDITVPKVETGCYTSYGQVKGLVYFSTLPHRQWKKGLCAGNSLVSAPINYYAKNTFSDNYFKYCITDILTQEYPKNLDHAIARMLEHKFPSFAVNNSFGISLNFQDKDESILFLWYKEFLIGKVYPKQKQIVVENDVFFQEVIDSCHQWCPNYKVNLL